MEYLDFDVMIQPSGDNYLASVIFSPGGQAKAAFSLPFDEKDKKIFRLTMADDRRLVRGGIDRPSAVADAKKFGGDLFDAIFRGNVRDVLLRSITEAREEGKGLRLRLRLTDVPTLTDIPWEYLYYNRFLALSRKTPLVRFLDVGEPEEPLKVELPLRMLVMVSNPKDYSSSLDVSKEVANLRSAVSDLVERKLFELDVLEEPTLPALLNRVKKGDYHIFHFIGHGGVEDGEGVLILEDELKRASKVSGEQLAAIFWEHPMRLVVLNACEGARGNDKDPFGGMAQKLVQQCLPAVIAMQFEITDSAAITFAHEFYKSIAEGAPVDAALSDARMMIFARSRGLEWGTPVLYMRSPDGRIFDVNQLNVPVVTPAAASAPGAVAFSLAPGRRAAVRSANAVPAGTQSRHPMDDVQFSAYQPHTVRPEVWSRLLAFAYPTFRREGAPEDEPHPLEEVQRRVQEILGEVADDYRPAVREAQQPVPVEGELTFVPSIEGIEFNPPRRTFAWQGAVHHEVFEARAPKSLAGETVEGMLSVFLGGLIIADVPLSFRVDSRAASTGESSHKESSVKPYRKIFASYSHKDQSVVEQFERYARALGDEYLRDVTRLRAGEVWAAGVKEMIKEADVFQLFWSENSMRSPFVRQEWEYALALDRPYFVRPTYWDDPLPGSPAEELPPNELACLHFQRIQVPPGPGPGQPGPAAQDESVQGESGAAGSSDAPQLEQPGGVMNIDSAFYIKRPEDEHALSIIEGQAVSMLIKAPGQMGRSSLLQRVINRAKDHGMLIADIDFSDFGRATLTNGDIFYRRFCAAISYKLKDYGITDRVAEQWRPNYSDTINTTDYLKDYILPHLNRPLLLAMDEVDCFYESDYRPDFFTMLRNLHNRRAQYPVLGRLGIVFVTSADPSQLVEWGSPWNLGTLIELRDFGEAEVAKLNRLHGGIFDSSNDKGVPALTRLVHGHPHLVRLALYKAAKGFFSPEKLFTCATHEDGPFGSHLRFLRDRVEEKDELVEGLRKVLGTNTFPPQRVKFHLTAMGLIREEMRQAEDSKSRPKLVAVPRCKLYEDYFNERIG